MTTRMMHPEHGWTHAYGEADIEAHKKNGWVVESEVKQEKVDPPEPEKRKPGRPKKAE